MKLTHTMLAAITSAAAALVPIEQIAAEVKLSKEQWNAALLNDLEAVRLAVLRGRIDAFMKNAQALELCGFRYGKATVACFMLQKNHGWPARSRGRPPKSKHR